jgi:hypothetical protein
MAAQDPLKVRETVILLFYVGCGTYGARDVAHLTPAVIKCPSVSSNFIWSFGQLDYPIVNGTRL